MSDDSGKITCHTTRWYTRRRILMIVLFLGFSGWFFRDWKWAYPKERAVYDEYWPEYQKMLSEGREGEWIDVAKEKGWPEKPVEKNYDRKIAEQLYFGILTGVGGLALLVAFLRNRKRTLEADDVSFTTPDGRRVPFASAFRIDKRKWDHKGLAYVYYRDESGASRKAVIDDLIFGGAGAILDRLLSRFQGELIELERPAETQGDTGTPETASHDAGADAAEGGAAAAAAEDPDRPGPSRNT